MTLSRVSTSSGAFSRTKLQSKSATTKSRTSENSSMNETYDSLNPYNVEHIDGAYDYTFVTDSGREYVINFIDMTNYHADFQGVFMFNLYSADKSPHPIDIRISHTVVDGLRKVFETQSNSMVMICDNTDGKEYKRSRLFSRWFDIYATPDIAKYDASVNTEYYAIYASLYVHKLNPNANKIIKAFKDIVMNEFYPV